MWLANTSIRRPVFATMAILCLVVLGIVSYPRIGVDLFPKVDFPVVNITTFLRGANSEIIDIDVTDKIEEAVNTINGVKTITSTSTEGVSRVIVEFILEKDIDLAVQDVKEKISIIRGKLPKDIDEPIIEKVDQDAVPIIWLALTGKKSIRDLSTYADEVLKEQLQRIEGVGAIRTGGIRLRQVREWLDGDKLSAYGITAYDVVRALQRENIELPGGRIEGNTKEYSIKIKGEFRRVEEFNELIIGYYSGATVRLKDIGRVEDGMEERRSITRFNRISSIGLGIQKQSGTNTVEVIDRIKRELVNIRKALPPDMDIKISFDQSTFIKRSINEVQHHLIYGGIFATLSVLLFLRSLRITLISALAIPVSVISTFTIMNAFGFTFNNMSMLALSLSIGILIDDAIIVIENIHRHIEEGMATTISIVAIFLPVAFMKGIIGRFFMQFALTVVFAVMVSLFVSFTLTPMMASRYLKTVKHKSHWLDSIYKKFEDLYKILLKIALNHRVIVLISATAIFIFSLYITKFIGKEFLPPEDQSRFIARLQAPVHYSVDEIDRLFKKAEEIIISTREVNTVFYSQGSGGKQIRGLYLSGLSQG